MATAGILVSELAKRTGTTRKALRLYEAAGLIAPDSRTEAGYRLYTGAAVPLVTFILKARRAGFTVAEIGEIVRMRRSGQPPCDHVRALIDTKLTNIDRALADLRAARDQLAAISEDLAKAAQRIGGGLPPHRTHEVTRKGEEQ